MNSSLYVSPQIPTVEYMTALNLKLFKRAISKYRYNFYFKLFHFFVPNSLKAGYFPTLDFKVHLCYCFELLNNRVTRVVALPLPEIRSPRYFLWFFDCFPSCKYWNAFYYNGLDQQTPRSQINALLVLVLFSFELQK